MHSFESRLSEAVLGHDLLAHPFYQAWSHGRLTRGDLAGYAAQYRHQVEVLPSLLGAGLAQASDDAARAALARNLDEEEGRIGPPHLSLWNRFAEAVDAPSAASADAETAESSASLAALCGEGEVEALAALWAYELQTQRVARTKRDGLLNLYGVHEVSFFSMHEELDTLHAQDLLAAVKRRCEGDAALEARAVHAAGRAARAQWRFLDGAEARRAA